MKPHETCNILLRRSNKRNETFVCSSEKHFWVTFKQETSMRQRSKRIWSFAFFGSAVSLLRAALKMCEIFDKSREQMLICLPPPPRGLTCVPAIFFRSAVIFSKSLFLAHMNCGVLTTADPSCWSDRSWVAWVDGLMDSCGFYPHLRLEARHPLSNPRSFYILYLGFVSDSIF